MTKKQLKQMKADYREWNCGFSPLSAEQITVYMDYALREIVGVAADDIREALIEWYGADDPDDDLYAPGERRPTMLELIRRPQNS